MSQVYQISQSPGKGQGVFATQLIHAGTRILAEVPLLTLVNGQDSIIDLYNAFLSLPQADQQRYLSLSYHTNEDKQGEFAEQAIKTLSERNQQDDFDAIDLDQLKLVAAVLYTNGFSFCTYDDNLVGTGICYQTARINHSCLPNASHTWNETIGMHTVHALRDIAPGEELTITYRGTTESRQRRRASLKGAYGFDCDCPACDMKTEFGKKSAQRRTEMAENEELIKSSPGAATTIAMCRQQIALMEAEGLNGAEKEAVLSELSNALEERGLLPAASVEMGNAIEIANRCYGDDSKRVHTLQAELERINKKIQKEDGWD